MRSISGRKCVIDSDVTEMGSPQGPRDGVRSRAIGEFDVVEEKEKMASGEESRNGRHTLVSRALVRVQIKTTKIKLADCFMTYFLG